MKLLIDIDEKEFTNIQNLSDYYIDFRFFSLETIAILAIKNGTPLPKGHGRLFDERDIVNGNYEIIGNKIYEVEPIIEADTESEDKERSE